MGVPITWYVVVVIYISGIGVVLVLYSRLLVLRISSQTDGIYKPVAVVGPQFCRGSKILADYELQVL